MSIGPAKLLLVYTCTRGRPKNSPNILINQKDFQQPPKPPKLHKQTTTKLDIMM